MTEEEWVRIGPSYDRMLVLATLLVTVPTIIVTGTILTTERSSITLSCSSPSPWFFCVWEGPRGNRVCSLKDDIGRNNDDSLCGEDNRVKISGE